jgi:hypothetical protein
MSDKGLFGPGLGAAALLLLGLAPLPAPGADKPAPDEEKRCAAGTCVGETAAMFRREAPGKPWQLVTPKETLQTGDLLVGGGGAVLDSQNGAVRVAFLGDLAELSPFPVRECAVVLRDEPPADLAFTLDRGRVNVSNRKDAGAAHVRVHVRQDTWDLTLTGPGATIALELYGRWPPGVPFTRDPGPNDVPTANLVFLVVKGEVMLKHGVHQHALKAPPGAALIEWDSVDGMDPAPHTLKELPPWAQEGADETPLAQKKKKALARLRQLLLSRSIDEALDELVSSDDPAQRRLAVFVMGALDDLPRLGKVLRESRHPDVWDHGVQALRHWIGRSPGQDQILYQRLIEGGKYSPATAEAIVQLLHSFGEAELARPETYEALIDYLDSDHLPLRGLAYWHLERLVPAGEEFGYDPTAPKEQRAAAVEKWKKLIPNGKLPPRPAARDGK